jgi:hypothetical protein
MYASASFVPIEVPGKEKLGMMAWVTRQFLQIHRRIIRVSR